MHDSNGTAVKVGDIVLIEAKITATYAVEDFCNATLLLGFAKPHGADNIQSHVTINTRQALLFKSA